MGSERILRKLQKEGKRWEREGCILGERGGKRRERGEREGIKDG